MTTVLAGLLFAIGATKEATITREPFGVPCVAAAGSSAVFYGMGRAVAQDRLWQMEMSRRSAEGRLAEVLGPKAVASDLSVLRRSYTEDEIREQFQRLPQPVQAAFEAYKDGVNDEIAFRRGSKTLPPGYASNHFEPEPWTIRDSCAILISLTRRFGAGAAGELRNLGLLEYLKLQKCRKNVLDVVDDIAFQNDPHSPTTLSAADTGPDISGQIFPGFTRAQTVDQLASLPKVGLFEIAGALGAVTFQDQNLLAAKLGVPYKVGSYAIVVSPQRSATGNALLLNGPQMGHTDPSVVHEIALEAPGMQVAGIDIPGVPIIAVGSTPRLAWGLTSGVADLEDIFVTKWVKNASEAVTSIPFVLKVKGESDRKFVQRRTTHGPVLLLSEGTKCAFSLQSSYWGKELAGMAALFRIYQASSGKDIDRFAPDIAVTFNLFYATTKGETGYRYIGHVPKRAPGLDPRFPTPDVPANQWRGEIPFSQMPQATNPKSGLLVNWNNKSVSWWPNGDSPIWGSPFRSQNITDALGDGPFRTTDLERAVWQIAHRDDSFQILLLQKLMKVVEPGLKRTIGAYDGWDMDGSPSAAFAAEFTRQLRHGLFEPEIGNFTNEALFTLATPVGFMLKALDKKTSFDYLAGRTASSILLEAAHASVKKLGSDPTVWAFHPGSIFVGGNPTIPYSNRGTYIQICELSDPPRVRTIASPGVAEEGDHARDQVPLAQAWTYKLQHRWAK